MNKELNQAVEKVLQEIFKDAPTVTEIKEHNRALSLIINSPIRFGDGYICADHNETVKLKELLNLKLEENNLKIKAIA